MVNNIFKCEYCNYTTGKNSNIKRHNKTKKHFRNKKEKELECKSSSQSNSDISTIEIYECKKCKYLTDVKWNLIRHKQTKKHLSLCKSGCKSGSKTGSKKRADDNIKERKYRCNKCRRLFSHRQSLYNHKKFNRCKKIPKIKKKIITNNTTNNITNNTTNNTITNHTTTIENQNIINITFNINSQKEAEAIKAILTREKLIEICKPERRGLPLQSYDIVKKIQSLSIESKKNNKELQNFRKTNFRDDIIDVLENNVFKKRSFKEYNRADLHKFAKHLMDKCQDLEPDKSYEEKLDLICDVLTDYDYYKNLPEEHQHGTTSYIIQAIDECEKLAKLEFYNITQNIEDDSNSEEDIKEIDGIKEVKEVKEVKEIEED